MAFERELVTIGVVLSFDKATLALSVTPAQS
jgi:hypothetical protein